MIGPPQVSPAPAEQIFRMLRHYGGWLT